MSQTQRPQAEAKPAGAREQLERLYRDIGISAVAAAAAQMSRTVPKDEPTKREIPACLRDDMRAA